MSDPNDFPPSMRAALRTFCAIILAAFTVLSIVGFIAKNGLEGAAVLVVLVSAILGIAFL